MQHVLSGDSFQPKRSMKRYDKISRSNLSYVKQLMNGGLIYLVMILLTFLKMAAGFGHLTSLVSLSPQLGGKGWCGLEVKEAPGLQTCMHSYSPSTFKFVGIHIPLKFQIFFFIYATVICFSSLNLIAFFNWAGYSNLFFSMHMQMANRYIVTIIICSLLIMLYLLLGFIKCNYCFSFFLTGSKLWIMHVIISRIFTILLYLRDIPLSLHHVHTSHQPLSVGGWF